MKFKGFLSFLSILIVFLVVFSSSNLSLAQDTSLRSPPTPRFKLTAPRVNEMVYTINVKNIQNHTAWIRIDFAIPKTWPPDVYVELKEVKGNFNGHFKNYSARGNEYVYTMLELEPGKAVQINVTFYSLKYKLEYYIHKRVRILSYPEELRNFTLPEKFIESNDPLIVNKAVALAGDLRNPFRIAERIYDFVISYLKYEVQPEAHGALWAFINGRGDCTEYGTLFVALMRALGIPARTVIGHVSRGLSQGGIVNATRIWVDSPHLWAEFYVGEFGWVPADPTFGTGDPWDHFAITWAHYLPFIKGPIMDPPYRSLLTIKTQPPNSINYTAQLLVNPLAYMPFKEKAIGDIYEANNLTNTVRRIAYQAYKKYAFNITSVYPALAETYELLHNATKEILVNPAIASGYAEKAAENAVKTLNIILDIVISDGKNAVKKAWGELRILGALSGENYIAKAEEFLSRGQYSEALMNIYYAKTTAEQAPTIHVFIGPLLLCIATIWVIRRRNG